jgi:hypothetical protein
MLPPHLLPSQRDGGGAADEPHRRRGVTGTARAHGVPRAPRLLTITNNNYKPPT